jgi:arylsulfatase
MEVYAAQVDSMDQNIGRLLDELERTGQAENTLVIFFSDNGASAENYDQNELPPGPIDSFRSYKRPWANVSNTPLRHYKKSDWYGGMLSPMIARWPGKVEAGAICDEFLHVMDFMPTFIDVAGGEYPEQYNGHAIRALDGKSQLPLLLNGEPADREHHCWKLWAAHAILQDRWKLVGRGADDDWELYDIEQDRCELNDLKKQHPQKTAELQATWERWHEKVSADRNAY